MAAIGTLTANPEAQKDCPKEGHQRDHLNFADSYPWRDLPEPYENLHLVLRRFYRWQEVVSEIAFSPPGTLGFWCTDYQDEVNGTFSIQLPRLFSGFAHYATEPHLFFIHYN